jgi:hypothetical protein
MREILIKNQEILDRLNGFTKVIQVMDINELKIDDRDPDISAEYAVSKEYLQVILDKGLMHKGDPEAIKAVDLIVLPISEIPTHWKEFADDVAFNFTRELGVQQNALCAYYPEDGYIGWHDNHDAPGYTLLFNWSETGDSFYRFRDPKTKEIVTIKDRPGWSCKTGWYGKGDGSTFHCAKTNEPRWSIAFYIQDENMKDIIIDALEND